MENLIKELDNRGELYIKDNSLNQKNKTRVNNLISKYTFLKQYNEYITFLYKYSGLTYNCSNGSLSFYGLEGDMILDIDYGEGNIINKDGFFIIGDYGYYSQKTEKYKSIGFGIDSTGKKANGIHILSDNHSREIIFNDFENLLKVLVNNAESLL
jgi:hypothetical protein